MADDPNPQGFDLSSLLEQAQQMGEQMARAQQEAEARVVTGQAGGGAVRIEVTGGLEFTSVSIDPGAVQADDIEMLEDLVLAALNDAIAQLQPSGGAADLDLGGLDLGGLDLGKLLGPGSTE